MDALANILGPYSELIGKFAGAVTCLQFLSAVVLINDIRKKGSSDKFPVEPFVGGIVLTVVSIRLALLMGDGPMITVNIIGFVINTVFLLVFYYYTSAESKPKFWNKFGIACAITAVCLLYSYVEDQTKIEARLGAFITTVLVMLVGSPLLNLGEIVKKKSTEGLAFPMILSGTIVAASWLLYGISIRNDIVVYQNLLLFTLSFAQLSLFAIYPNSQNGAPPAKKSSPVDLKKKKVK